MPGIGFYSGYLDALKIVSGVDQRDQQLALEQQNQERLNQMTQVQMRGQLQQQAFDRANFYKQEDAQQVLGTLFQQNATASANADANAQSDITSYRDWETDRKSTRLNSSHITRSRMPSSA